MGTHFEEAVIQHRSAHIDAILFLNFDLKCFSLCFCKGAYAAQDFALLVHAHSQLHAKFHIESALTTPVPGQTHKTMPHLIFRVDDAITAQDLAQVFCRRDDLVGSTVRQRVVLIGELGLG